MTRTISLSQAKNMIRQMQSKQRQAVSQYNQKVARAKRELERLTRG